MGRNLRSEFHQNLKTISSYCSLEEGLNGDSSQTITDAKREEQIMKWRDVMTKKIITHKRKVRKTISRRKIFNFEAAAQIGLFEREKWP